MKLTIDFLRDKHFKIKSHSIDAEYTAYGIGSVRGDQFDIPGMSGNTLEQVVCYLDENRKWVYVNSNRPKINWIEGAPPKFKWGMMIQAKPYGDIIETILIGDAYCLEYCGEIVTSGEEILGYAVWQVLRYAQLLDEEDYK